MANDFEPNGRCLLTGAPAEVWDDPARVDQVFYRSKPCGLYVVSRTLRHSSKLWQTRADQLYLLAGLARRYSDSGRTLELSSKHLSDSDFLDELLASIRPPSTPFEQIDALISWIFERANRPGSGAPYDLEHDHTIIFAKDAREFRWIYSKAVELKYVEQRRDKSDQEARLTLEGWKRADEIRRQSPRSNRAFVAMSFSDDLTDIWKDAIEPALREAGWDPIRVDGIEHNEKIDDLIISKLKKSGLCVAEFTQHKPNVYFEAGFARGMGIPVIWLCREDDIADAHFDTRQFNHIVWKDAQDLRIRLELRIRATV